MKMVMTIKLTLLGRLKALILGYITIDFALGGFDPLANAGETDGDDETA